MIKASEEKKLNKEQLESVQHGEGPLLIIAGAGTGKTTVVTERIKHLITKSLAKPAEILALTFTQKAAREMEERVDVLMPYGYTQMWISTFHSFCDRILRQESIHMGINPGYRLLSDTDITMFIRKNLFAFDLDYFRPLGNPTKFIGGMINHFSRLKDEDVSPSQYTDWVKTQNSELRTKNEEEKLEMKKYQELASTYKVYEELKVKEGVMDFADLISYGLKLFRERKNILKNYQNQFKFILVDEFQDTNIAQNELLLLLAGKSQNITAVADDDQSIYKFRGAAVSNVIAFRKSFPQAKLIVLSKNYRSTQEILDKSYQLIQHNNPDRLEVKEGINKKLVAMRKSPGQPVEFLYNDRVENEAEAVVKEIKKLVDIKVSKYSWKDFAILVRANNHAEPFVRALIRKGIPFQFLGPGQLFRQPEVKDLISYLQVLSNFEDSVALFRVLSMEYFDIATRDLIAVAICARKFNLSLFESCEAVADLQKFNNVVIPQVSDESREKLTKIITMIHRHLKLLHKEAAGQILYYFLEDTGLIKNILDYKFPIDEKKAANMSKFFSKLKTYEAEHEDATVVSVLDWIILSMELGESPLASDTDWVNNDAVNILTVHSAKGLEFKVVFLVNLVGQRFPTTEKKEQIPIPLELIKEVLPEGDYHEQEERRLFYVGMTRARDLLYFTAANYYGEGVREKKISPFVFETLGVDAKIAATTSSQLSLIDWQKEELPKFPGAQKSTSVSYLSYSQIDTFSLCPLHYKLRYILNIPPPTSPALSFGSSIHSALRDFYNLAREGGKVTKEKLLELLLKNWIRQGYSDKKYESEMFARGKKYLEDYFDREFNREVRTVLIEQPFTVPIRTAASFLKVGGRIDRVDDLGGGKIEIVDYKTGRVPSKREIDANLQLSIYAIAATEVHEFPFARKAADVTLTLYYFDSRQKISTTRSMEQLQKEKERIMTVARNIEISDFRCSGNPICKTCEYKFFCGVLRD